MFVYVFMECAYECIHASVHICLYEFVHLFSQGDLRFFHSSLWDDGCIGLFFNNDSLFEFISGQVVSFPYVKCLLWSLCKSEGSIFDCCCKSPCYTYMQYFHFLFADFFPLSNLDLIFFGCEPRTSFYVE